MILHYSNSYYTLRVLESLCRELKNIDVATNTVVINNSGICCSELEDWVEKKSDGTTNHKFHLIHTPENLGYGQGMNFGAKRLNTLSHHEYIFLLNNDVYLGDSCISALQEYISENPQTKIIGTTVLDTKSGLIQCAGGCTYYSWFGISKAYLKGKPLEAIKSKESAFRNVKAHLDYIYGAAFLVRSDFFYSIGMFNEEYFLYFEELELASQCDKNEMGWCTDAVIYHEGGGTAESSDKVSSFCVYHAALSCFRYTCNKNPLKILSVILTRLFGKLIHAIVQKKSYHVTSIVKATADLVSGKTRRKIKDA